jgi:hypothetical protein
MFRTSVSGYRIAAGFEPWSMLLMLCSPATRPISTRVLNGRVVGNCSRKMIEQTQIQTEQIGTRPLETQHTANTIHIVVDNFGVKFVGEEHANHLKRALDEHYKLTCDWTETRYIGITLD